MLFDESQTEALQPQPENRQTKCNFQILSFTKLSDVWAEHTVHCLSVIMPTPRCHEHKWKKSLFNPQTHGCGAHIPSAVLHILCMCDSLWLTCSYDLLSSISTHLFDLGSERFTKRIWPAVWAAWPQVEHKEVLCDLWQTWLWSNVLVVVVCALMLYNSGFHYRLNTNDNLVAGNSMNGDVDSSL